jgi:hypothetical protein
VPTELPWAQPPRIEAIDKMAIMFRVFIGISLPLPGHPLPGHLKDFQSLFTELG